jgi:hypothetical protein
MAAVVVYYKLNNFAGEQQIPSSQQLAHLMMVN